MKTILALTLGLCLGTLALAAEGGKAAPGQAVVPQVLAKGFQVHVSPASPCVLVRSDSPKLKLFQGLDAAGLGGPTKVAFAEEHKVKIVSTSTTIDPSGWTEAWMLFWFNGAKGWDKLQNAPAAIDLPVLVVLQHLPTKIAPAGTGVELTFPADAGYVAIVPLYGSGALAAAESAKWTATLPDDVFKRCRLMAEISREFPVSVEETFKIQPSQDKVLIRNRFEFFSIDDDFATPHKRVAPLEPAVALAQKQGFRLLSMTSKPYDPELVVERGIFAGIEGDECVYTLTGLLRYVNQVDPAGKKETVQATPSVGDWGGLSTSPAEVAAAIGYARGGYWGGNEDAYRFGCYATAKALTQLWTAGVARPKWMQEKGLGTAEKLELEKLSPEQIRFMKDRMPDLAKGLPDAAAKTVLIWKDGAWTPKPDGIFRRGVTETMGLSRGMVLSASTPVNGRSALWWLSPAGITDPTGKRGEGLRLGDIKVE